MMLERATRSAAILGVALLAGLPVARADIYTWVDARGSLNVSNIAPPDGVKVTKVAQDSPPIAIPPPNPALDAYRQAEVQMLSDRVHQLEQQVATAPPPVQPVMVYPPPMASPPAPQYAMDTSWQQNGGCDPNWGDCGGWSNPGPYAQPYGYPYAYPVSVIVVRAASNRRFYQPGRGGYNPGTGNRPGNRPMPMPMLNSAALRQR
jgi:hypothetical protein